MRTRLYLAVIGAVTLTGAGLTVASGALATGDPTSSTGTASAVTNTTATVTGSVNPDGQATNYAFQYGTTTQYAEQTVVGEAGAGTASETVSTQLAGLQPGTTYHLRLIASNESGSAAGNDVTFTTTGPAPPSSTSPILTTGAATGVGIHNVVLNGTINPSGSSVRYYFQLGTNQPYELATPSQTLPAGNVTVPVRALVSGLQSRQPFHYRLVAVKEGGSANAGSDLTFSTMPKSRVNPRAVEVSVSPVFQRRLPDIVTVSGRLVAPPTLSNELACRGYVDIGFRVRTIAIQFLRAGIHSDCTFSLPVRFSIRRRLLGGRVRVEVLFAGNRFMHRLAAPTQTIQIG
jgi:phosphodiesterase/alkaline phosphatase D-like protein